jgi:hypothetical protein
VTAVYTSKAGLDIEPVLPKRVTKEARLVAQQEESRDA